MNDRSIYHLAGGLGLTACVLTLMEFPLWMIGGAVPSFSDINAVSHFAAKNSGLYLTRTLLDMVIFVFLLTLLSGFSRRMKKIRADFEWPA
ncbi:MAG: hypothetical protein P4L50_29590 [Anaerolineaceae bacterium]|nr:hypothetical protein [Anaerolineaceae bacterium]